MKKHSTLQKVIKHLKEKQFDDNAINMCYKDIALLQIVYNIVLQTLVIWLHYIRYAILYCKRLSLQIMCKISNVAK